MQTVTNPTPRPLSLAEIMQALEADPLSRKALVSLVNRVQEGETPDYLVGELAWMLADFIADYHAGQAPAPVEGENVIPLFH